MSRSSRRRGFTLVELIVVSGMSTLLFGQLFTAIQDAREAARRSQCKNNLKQIALAMHNYHDTFQQFPVGWVGVDLDSKKPAALGMSGWGWGVMLFPYIDQFSIYSQVAFSNRVDDENNAKFLTKQIPAYRCPSDPYSKKTWKIKDDKNAELMELATTNYVTPFGTGDVRKCQSAKLGEPCIGDGLFFQNSSVNMADVKDGTSNTLLAGECYGTEKADRFATWSGVIAKGKDPFARILGASDRALDAKEPNAASYRSGHKDGVHFIQVDGATRFIKTDIDLKVFQALTTRAGGEEIPEP